MAEAFSARAKWRQKFGGIYLHKAVLYLVASDGLNCRPTEMELPRQDMFGLSNTRQHTLLDGSTPGQTQLNAMFLTENSLYLQLSSYTSSKDHEPSTRGAHQYMQPG